MKHKKLLLLWLLIPVPAIAWHYGPGQRYLALDEARSLSRRATRAEQRTQWEEAAVLFSQAAAQVGVIDADARRRYDMATARAQARAGNPAEGLEILDRVLADPAMAAEPEATAQARELSARITYHAAWVMRLEGAAREEWLPVAEESRQNFRLLAETDESQTTDSGPASNVEAAVRLQRMSLTELMAKPLPSECQGMCNKNVKEKMCKRGACKKACKKPGKPKEEEARENKGMGLGERQEGAGS